MTKNVSSDERRVLAGVAVACDEHDWDACRASLACGGEPTKAQRQIIRDLVTRGLLRLERGGQDEDGQFIGGTFYGVTNAGRAALNETAA